LCMATFVVIEIILEYSAQPSLIEDNDVIQEITSLQLTNAT
jgi:hypothetical protein